ncbi:MAG: N-acyl-L-amino acid amidohydrolase [Leifsonia sp.]|nr:N-acyl-L-amino acid amidohydrolase [Leifsonia sp.]
MSGVLTEDTPLVELREQALQALVTALPEAVELRHNIHRDPHVGGDEASTVARLVELLTPVNNERVVLDVAGGLIVRSGAAGGSIAIRAELDALPIQEASDLPWASRRPGVAHLCGHDAHTAALVATIRAIEAVGVPVPFVAIFQPREEVIPAGAIDMIAAPQLADQELRALVGVHVQPVLTLGSASVVPGPINAAADNFEITVRGRAAHGAYPHLGRDPILAAAAIVQALQQLVARRVDPMRPAVVTVGSINGGSSHNAITTEVVLQGTLRSYDGADQEMLHTELRRIAESVATGHGCEALVSLDFGEPVLRNDGELADLVATALTAHGIELAPALRSCGADDFSYYCQHYRSLMIFAGVGDGVPGAPGLHHPGFVPPDETVGELARIMLLSYFAIAEQLYADSKEAR